MKKNDNEKLLFVLEVARHGARSPDKILDLNKTSVNFNDSYQLLEGGFLQHFYLGDYLRSRYIENEHFLSPFYNSKEVYVRTTNAIRTIESAKA